MDSGGCSVMAEYMVIRWNMMSGCSGGEYMVSQ